MELKVGGLIRALIGRSNGLSIATSGGVLGGNFFALFESSSSV